MEYDFEGILKNGYDYNLQMWVKDALVRLIRREDMPNGAYAVGNRNKNLCPECKERLTKISAKTTCSQNDGEQVYCLDCELLFEYCNHEKVLNIVGLALKGVI